MSGPNGVPFITHPRRRVIAVHGTWKSNNSYEYNIASALKVGLFYYYSRYHHVPFIKVLIILLIGVIPHHISILLLLVIGTAFFIDEVLLLVFCTVLSIDGVLLLFMFIVPSVDWGVLLLIITIPFISTVFIIVVIENAIIVDGVIIIVTLINATVICLSLRRIFSAVTLGF